MTPYVNDFLELYGTLMETNFMRSAQPIFRIPPTENRILTLVNEAASTLPIPYRKGYSDQLVENMPTLFARYDLKNPRNALFLEALAGSVYQHQEQKRLLPALRRFLAVVSDLYRSFLDETKRQRLEIEISEIVPPLAVFQSSPANGPFTIPIDDIFTLFGAEIGVVSLPASFADHPLFYSSLSHETGGHDVVHADPTLLPQLKQEAHTVLDGMAGSAMGLLWDYWMDEAASDVYGVLNMGPTFGANLALLLAVFVAQGNPAKAKRRKIPFLRTSSGANEDGSLDVHPTDLIRISLIQGAISALASLSKPTRDRYIAELEEIAALCGGDTTSVELSGFPRIPSGRSMNFQDTFPISDLRQSARLIGAHIATASLQALGGMSIQAVETWNDADENSSNLVATLLRTDKSVVNSGDDGQLLAGLTLAVMDQPSRYDEFSKRIDEALDDSFRRDPYWGAPEAERFIVRPSRPMPVPASPVDPFAARIIDYNPLEQEIGLGADLVSLHAIDKISWPNGLGPKAKPLSKDPSPQDALPKATIVLVTWTAAEANAMSMVMTPGYISNPPRNHAGGIWYDYAKDFQKKYQDKLRFGSSPALVSKTLGKYFMSSVGDQSVLCFKSNLHLARDLESLPVLDLFKQVAAETRAKLIITTGTAGAIGPRLVLGDAVIATNARFDCMRMFKNASFNNKTYTSAYSLTQKTMDQITYANSKLVPANVSHLPSLPRSPRIYSGAAVLTQPNVIVTTDIFAYDDSTDHYQLQGKGSMVEMDDAVLGLACDDLGASAPQWLAIRNASDPQVGPNLTKADAAKIYEQYGYWTTLTSVLACWSVITTY